MPGYADRVRALALSLPRTYEDAPWGNPVFKVGANRMFALVSEEADTARVTVKLTPDERELALMLPFVTPARYVGRYGWVTATVTDEETLETVLEWVRESWWLRAPVSARRELEGWRTARRD